MDSTNAISHQSAVHGTLFQSMNVVSRVTALLSALASISSMIRCGSNDQENVGSHLRKGSFMRWLIFCTVALLAMNVSAIGQEMFDINPVFQIGERLQYKVKWGFLRLGTVTICTGRDTSCANPALFKLTMVVQSNPDLRAVWIWEYNESIMDGSALLSRRFLSKQVSGDDGIQVRLSYDVQRRVVTYVQQELYTGKLMMADTLRDVPPYVEGPSLFFLARCLARTRRSLSVPTCVDGKMSSTLLDFTLPTEDIEVDAIPHPVRVRKYIGAAQWQGGAAGLTGSFAGWVSDDEAAVPLKAEMKVLLGSIHVELEKWDRVGWIPPKGLHASNNN